jgi:hypothetical protein
MGCGPCAARRHIDFARIGFGVSDKLAGNDEFTSMTRGDRTTLATGAMLWMELKLSFS